MSVRDTLDTDIINFFENIESQDINDRRQTLRNLMDKYIHLTKATLLMDKHDLEVIISGAKSLMAGKTFPVVLGDNKRRVHENEQVTLCIVESTVSHLNKKDCLKRLPKFDYRSDTLEE
jgi:hypothetical protein